MDVRRRKINLHIEKLTFVGMPAVSHERVKNALIRELTRLISQKALLSALTHDRHIPKKKGGKVQFLKNATPEIFGTRLAVIIHKGIV